MCEYSLRCPFSEGSKDLFTRFEAIPWHGELLLASSGKMPHQRTRFKCFWERTRLSFMYDCEDSDIRATMKERNSRVWKEEAVELFVSPGAEEPLVYYEFQLSPANVSRQVRVTVPLEGRKSPRFDDSWQCRGISTETHINGYLNNPNRKSVGWQAIISIPLECFVKRNQTIRSGDTWRINIFRIDRWPREMYCAWSPTYIDPPSFHSPRHFGYLVFC